MLRRIFLTSSCSRASETTVSSDIFPLDTTTGGLVTLNNPCSSIKIADPSLPLTKRVEETRPWTGADYQRKREAEREGEETEERAPGDGRRARWEGGSWVTLIHSWWLAALPPQYWLKRRPSVWCNNSAIDLLHRLHLVIALEAPINRLSTKSD